MYVSPSFILSTFAGRPKDLIKSLSLPVDRPSDCDGRTAADGDSSVAATICHRTAHHTRGDTDNASLRAAEQFCDSQNGNALFAHSQLSVFQNNNKMNKLYFCVSLVSYPSSTGGFLVLHIAMIRRLCVCDVTRFLSARAVVV